MIRVDGAVSCERRTISPKAGPNQLEPYKPVKAIFISMNSVSKLINLVFNTESIAVGFSLSAKF